MPAFFLSLPGVVAVVGILVLAVHGLLTRSSGRGRLRAAPADRTTLAMRVVISLVVLAAALYVILAKPDAVDDHKWAYSVVGTIVGYWIKA